MYFGVEKKIIKKNEISKSMNNFIEDKKKILKIRHFLYKF